MAVEKKKRKKEVATRNKKGATLVPFFTADYEGVTYGDNTYQKPVWVANRDHVKVKSS